MTWDTGPLPASLYRRWLVWPPKRESEMWAAERTVNGRRMIRTAKTEADVKRQVDEYEDGTESQ